MWLFETLAAAATVAVVVVLVVTTVAVVATAVAAATSVLISVRLLTVANFRLGFGFGFVFVIVKWSKSSIIFPVCAVCEYGNFDDWLVLLLLLDLMPFLFVLRPVVRFCALNECTLCECVSRCRFISLIFLFCNSYNLIRREWNNCARLDIGSAKKGKTPFQFTIAYSASAFNLTITQRSVFFSLLLFFFKL